MFLAQNQNISMYAKIFTYIWLNFMKKCRFHTYFIRGASGPHRRGGGNFPRLLQGRHVVGEDHGAAAEGHHGGQGLSFGQRHLDPRHLLKKCQFFCAVNFLMELGPIGTWNNEWDLRFLGWTNLFVSMYTILEAQMTLCLWGLFQAKQGGIWVLGR